MRLRACVDVHACRAGARVADCDVLLWKRARQPARGTRLWGGMAEEDAGMADEDAGMAEEDAGMAEEDDLTEAYRHKTLTTQPVRLTGNRRS
jgi:hypothetical protein